MKIFILTSELYPVKGGIASYVKNFSEALAQKNHEVIVFGVTEDTDKRQKQLIVNGVKVIRLERNFSCFPYIDMSYAPALSYQMANEVIGYISTFGKPDVIECQDYLALGYFLLQKKLQGNECLKDLPIVLTLHTTKYQLLKLENEPDYRFPEWWQGRLEQWTTLVADGFVIPSRFMLEQLEQCYRDNLKNIDVIPLLLDLDLAKGLNKFSPIPTLNDIVYCGRYQKLKGVIKLLLSCQQLWDKGINFHLTMIGNSCFYNLHNCDMKEYINSKYHKYIDKGLLVLNPAMQKPALYERIAKAWCVIIPSLWENFPNVCMESMLLQKVVLANINGGSKEMINYSDKPAGFIFDWQIEGDFEKKLEKVLNLSLEENIEIGKNARESILKMCSPEQVIPQRIAHFEQVIESCKSSERKIYPSLSYKPVGRIDYPHSLERIGVQGRVSVCIPYYNMGQYIRETLDSVYRANYADLEVIIWNDGSNEEESIRVLKEVQQEYIGLQVYSSENQGLAVARNRLAQLASGEYLAFLDADDKIHPNYYITSVGILNQYENVGLVCAWLQEFDANDGKWITWQTEFPYLLCRNTIISGSILRKSAFLQIDGMKVQMSRLGGFEDWECWINLHKHGWVGVVIPEFYFFYRKRQGSMYRSITKENRLNCEREIVKFHAQLYQLYGDEIFSLCNQNEISSVYWSTPDSRYSLPEVRVEVRDVETIVEVLVPDTQKSRMGAKDISFYSAKTLTKAMIWKILRKGAKVLNVSKSVKNKVKTILKFKRGR